MQAGQVPTPSGSPLTGRHRELEAFRQAQRTVLGGSPSVLQVIGETGIGRTRLLHEFELAARVDGVVCVSVRAAARDEAPLAPLRQAENLEHLRAFNALLSITEPPPDLFNQLLDALARDARAAPVWLLIDDLHAVDEATRTFVERLLAALYHGSLKQSAVGVVVSLVSGVATQELRDRLDMQDRRGIGRRLAPARLVAGEVHDWLTQRFGTPPAPDLARLLGNASGGNPLLLLELTLLLQRAGLLRALGGRLGIGPGADDITLPQDLTSVLQSKLHSISEPCRRALTLAAFLGKEFDALALADLFGREAETLEPLLEEATAASLLERRGSRSLGFKHAAARELLYAIPDRQSRERTHLQICEGLIGEFGDGADAHCLTITHHLIRAGGCADPGLVLRYAVQAADTAFRHHSYFLAGRYFEAAARAGRDSLPTARRAELHTRAGESFQRWLDGPRSTACFEEAVRLYRQCGDREGLARALHGLLRNLIAFDGPAESADTVAGQLEALLPVLPGENAELQVRARDSLAAFHHHRARYDVAESLAAAALDIARRSSDPVLRCIPVTSLALAQLEQLRVRDASTTWLEGLSCDRAAGATRYEGLHLQRLPVALYCLGETAQAAECLRASYQHNEAIGGTGELCLNITVDVMLANLRGDLDTAITAGHEALELMATTRYLWSAPALIGALAYALTMRERFDEAIAVIEHLTVRGLTFQDTAPFQSTAERLQRLVAAHRGGQRGATFGRRSDTEGPGLRGVRIGSLGRLCNETELALLQRAPARLGGIHDVLEFVHRRGVALSLGWCGSIPRSLAVACVLRGATARADEYFAEAGQLAERSGAELEHGRIALCRGLATLAGVAAVPGPGPRHEAAGHEAAGPRHEIAETIHEDLSRAKDCFAQFEVPALMRLAEDGLSRVAARR